MENERELMKIQTKFETGDKVWFYNKGQINSGKIIHIDISANGGTQITYQIDRKDKQYKDHNNYGYRRMNVYVECDHVEQITSSFGECDLGETKDEVLRILRRKEMERHDLELRRIEYL